MATQSTHFFRSSDLASKCSSTTASVSSSAIASATAQPTLGQLPSQKEMCPDPFAESKYSTCYSTNASALRRDQDFENGAVEVNNKCVLHAYAKALAKPKENKHNAAVPLTRT
ncbi:hypothetical protein ACN47E_007443 [Coniothyrium glycines]